MSHDGSRTEDVNMRAEDEVRAGEDDETVGDHSTENGEQSVEIGEGGVEKGKDDVNIADDSENMDDDDNVKSGEDGVKSGEDGVKIGEDSCIIFLRTNTHYNITCYDTKLSVLVGQCIINGYTLTPTSPPLPICSLNSHARVSANTGTKFPLTPAQIQECLTERNITSPDVVVSVGAVVLVERCTTLDTQLLRSTYWKLWNDEPACDDVTVKLHFFHLRVGLVGAVTIPGEWRLRTLLPTPGTNRLKVAVCGPKNAGKSTLCRYLVNSLLSHHTRVLFLETDIGQTELTPPGLVTLSVVSRPLVNPPYCNSVHFVERIEEDMSSVPHLTSISHCLGVVSPAQVMREYLDKVFDLIDTASHQTPPLVVNFMGWTKGFGVGLHGDILRCLEPTHVVNIQRNTTADLPPISELLETPGVLEYHPPTFSPPHISNVTSQAHENKEKNTPQAFQLRHMSLLNYFSPIYTNDRIEAPYKIHWRDIAVIPPDNIAHNLLSYTLNCSVVALLSGPRPQNTEEGGIRTTQEDLSAMRCLGLGIIRAVDVTAQVFYLNTPVSQQTLEQVFVFKHTSLPVPHVPSGTLPMPYLNNLSATEILTGSRSQRTNLKRKYSTIAKG